MSSGKTSKETAKVELSFMCTKLVDLDKFSKSDPFLILSAITVRQAGGEEPPQRLGQTEVIYDDLNPKVFIKYINFSRGPQRSKIMYEIT